MSTQNILFIIPLFISASISGWLGIYAWRNKSVAGSTSFVLLMCGVTVWSLGYAFEMLSPSLSMKLFWPNLYYFGVTISPAAWFMFSLEYTGRDRWLTRRRILALLIQPAITIILVWTNDFHHLIWRNARLVVDGILVTWASDPGPWWWFNLTYSYLLVLIGTLLIMQALFRSPRIYRGQSAALLIGVFVPWLANALFVAGLTPFPHLDVTPFAFTLTGIAMAWNLYQFRLLDIVPVAHDAVIESLSDAVIVLDVQNRVVDINPTARSILDDQTTEIIGRSADLVFANWPELVESYQDVQHLNTEIALGEGRSRRHIDLRITPLYDWRGRFTGRLIVVRDITKRKRDEAALRRHNEYLSLLHDTTIGLMSRIELDDLLETIVIRAGQLLGTPHGYVYLIEPFDVDVGPERSMDDSLKYKTLRRKVGLGVYRDSIGFTINYGEGLTGRVWQTGEPLAVNDYANWTGRAIKVSHEKSLRALMAAPLKSGEHVVGVIGIAYHFDAGRTFDETEIELLNQFAELASIALDNVRLVDAERDARQQAETLQQVAGVLSSVLSLDQLLDSVLQVLDVLVPYDSASVMLVQEDGMLRVVAARGFSESVNPFEAVFDPYRDPLISYVFADMRPTVLDDAKTDERFVHEGGANYIRGWIGAPLVIRGEVIGLLTIDSYEPNVYNAQRAHMVQTFAYHVAIAIENARLYTSAQQELKERRRAEVALQDAKNVAEAASRAKSTFLANMSHELRTPLNAIIGYSEMIQEEALELGNNVLIQDCERIRSAGTHLLDLINNILDISKIEAGKMDLFVEEFKVDDMIQNVANSVQPLIERNDNELSVEYNGDLGAMCADEIRVRQVLFNLLSNAAKFTSKGLITLQVRRQNTETGDIVCFQVTDTGIGMSADQVKHIFHAFIQGDATTTRRFGGTGLGLAISRHFCHLMGGDIAVTTCRGSFHHLPHRVS